MTKILPKEEPLLVIRKSNSSYLIFSIFITFILIVFAFSYVDHSKREMQLFLTFSFFTSSIGSVFLLKYLFSKWFSKKPMFAFYADHLILKSGKKLSYKNIKEMGTEFFGENREARFDFIIRHSKGQITYKGFLVDVTIEDIKLALKKSESVSHINFFAIDRRKLITNRWRF